MLTYCYHLRFLSPLHVSSGGFGYESTETFIRSDTLYSAICTIAAQIYPNEVLNKVFLNTPKSAIVVSSVFPRHKDTLFYPKPVSYFPANFDELEYTQQKNFKKVQFVDTALLEQLLNDDQKTFPDKKVDKEVDIKSGCWKTDAFDDNNGLYKKLEMPRIVTDRLSTATQIFHYAELHFSEDAGLFFVAQFDNKEAQEYFDTALRVLADTGIGGDRSVGKGRFEIVKTSKVADLPKSQNPNAALLLSLYVPTETELAAIDLQKSYYNLVTRQGWVSNHTHRRQTIRAFAEGSVLYFKDEHPIPVLQGEQLCVLKQEQHSTLTHNIYRNFSVISLPIYLNKEKNAPTNS